jgi:hypothetical protein
MEWQMTGGEPVKNPGNNDLSPKHQGPPTDSEEILHDLDEEDVDADADVAPEGRKPAKNEMTKTETVLEKANEQP